jgi:hypothetical protein
VKWWPRAALAVALLAVAAALTLPIHTPTKGPTRLSDRWPSATVTAVDGTLDGTDTFEPRLVVDKDTIVGLAISADESATRLVVRPAHGPVRVLASMRTLDARAVVAVTVAEGNAYWLESGPDSHGQTTTSVWRAGLREGSATLLSLAVSVPAYFDSQYDLQVVDGRLYWAAYLPQGRGEIRSIPIDGGPLTIRAFDRLYGLTAWPWATDSAGGQPGNVDLLNLVTGEHRTVTAEANQFLSCTPTWCRVTTHTPTVTVALRKLDGTKVADLSHPPANANVALLNRFEVVESTGNPVTLWLYDLRDSSDVLLEENAAGLVNTRDGFLWWSTGDNEATVWHVLDLRSLT